MNRILIVDDSLIVRRQVASVLLGANLNVVEAGDGLDAIAKLKLHRDVALVVCDISMPRMGGIEFLETLRVSSLQVDVIMLTTEADPELMAQAKRLGARGWLTKPVQPDLLLRLARHVLALKASPAARPG